MKANFTTYTFRLPKEMADELKEYARKLNKKESDVIEDAMSLFLKERIKEEMADTFN